MPTYVVLINWTDQGLKAARDSVERYEASSRTLEPMGLTITESYWTMGPYDIVNIIDAPDDETVTAGVLAITGAGNVRAITMRAFSSDETRAIVAKLG